ncbi:hypothetical protein CMV_021977 [Castanea mollissima]|uniref:Uncharacterized protein n=1 Tax=Castanea mollissima TaxID=60419 RepID=A0A8J4VL17_9ROSI|nr:hypothetical protein CMV_021977 [Castanea mollissima]
MNEPDLTDNPPTLFADSSSVADDGEGLYPCPVFNPDFSFEEGILHGFISSLCGTEEDDFTSRPWNENGLIEDYYEEEQMDYGDYWNWSSCFSDWQRENFYSLEDGTQDIGCGSSILGKMEDYSLGEEQHDNYFSYHEDTDNQFVIDYNPWYACRGEEDSHDYGRQQPMTAYDYNLDDMGLCEGIFGYWPCLFREKRRIIRSVEHY